MSRWVEWRNCCQFNSQTLMLYYEMLCGHIHSYHRTFLVFAVHFAIHLIMLNRNIIEWAKKSSRGVGQYQSRKMEHTSFIDLNARLGQPYCYTHQGDCEHIVIFTDLRFISNFDLAELLQWLDSLLCSLDILSIIYVRCYFNASSLN